MTLSSRRPGTRLRCGLLEPRLAPAVFDIADGDVAALVAAVHTANGNNQPDTINLAASGTYTFTGRADTAIGGSALPEVQLDGGSTANSLTINGNGATVRRSTAAGTPTFRFLKVGPTNLTGLGGAADVAVTGLTIRDFDASIVSDMYTPSGGGVLVYRANLRLTDCVLTNNRAQAGGIAVHAVGAQTHRVTLDRCTLTDNSGTAVSVEGPTLVVTGGTMAGNAGGGVFFQMGTDCTVTDCVIRDNGGAGVDATGRVTLGRVTVAGNGWLGVRVTGNLTVTDSTVSGNGGSGTGLTGGVSVLGTSGGTPGLTVTSSTIHGNRGTRVGGLDVNAGQSATFQAVITHSTITDNVATEDGRIGGVRVSPETPGARVRVGHTVVAGNTAAAGTPDLGGPYTSLGYNFVGDGTGSTNVGATAGQQVGTAAAPLDPKLGPLAANGGRTATRLPLATSPLVNAGNPAFAPPPAADQRGLPRVHGGRIDVGAVEAQPMTVAGVRVDGGGAQRSQVRSLTVTFSGPVTFANDDPAAAFQLSRITGAGGTVGLSATAATTPAGQTVVTLTFTGTSAVDPMSAQGGGQMSLADGRFLLVILDGAVTGPGGSAVDADGNGTAGGAYLSPQDTAAGGPGQLRLYRLFGDATGNGVVDATDLAAFRGAFNAAVGSPLYLDYLDANGNGAVDAVDLGLFRGRFNRSVF